MQAPAASGLLLACGPHPPGVNAIDSRTPAPTPLRTDHPVRPAWARRADRLTLVLARLLGRLVRRPREADLEALARLDRGPRPATTPSTAPGLAHARRALAEGHLAEALHQFGVLLELDANNAWAWHGRGDALQLLGQPAEALAAYERACSLDPAEGLHHGGRANALGALGRSKDAATAWQQALRLDPSLTWMRDGGRPPR